MSARIEPAPEEAGPTRLTDEAAVRAFAKAMTDKMALCRRKGRGGWQTCSQAEMWRLLRESVEKGDPVDVGNYAMMLWHLQRVAAA